MNAVAKTKSLAFQRGFAQISNHIKQALPPHVPFERFQRVVMMAVQKEPKLLECDQRSLFLECQKAAADGLLPDGREGVIVYRWNSKLGKTVAVWQPMVAGLMKLARNSGEIASITSQVVFEGEQFRVILGDEEKIEHERRLDLPENPKIVGAYAVAVLKNGERIREFMPWWQIEKVRNVNKDWAKGPWATWADEMSRKSCIRRLSKRLPLSTDRDQDQRLQSAIERTDEMTIEGFAEPVTAEAPASLPSSKLDAIEEAIDTTAAPYDPDTGEIIEGEAQQEEAPAATAKPPAPDLDKLRDRVDRAIKVFAGLTTMVQLEKEERAVQGLIQDIAEAEASDLGRMLAETMTAARGRFAKVAT